MANKRYPEDFRRDAVELYRVTEGASIVEIAAELGCSKSALTRWVEQAGIPTRGPRSAVRADSTTVSGENPDEELARLRDEVRKLAADKQRLMTERDILRKAAKYFAGETGW